MSSSLKNLESRGLIERIQSADNKKHIEIVLLNKADRIIEDGIKAQKEFAKIALDLIQQNKAQGRITDDPKDLCIYVDHCNGTSSSVLGQQALSNRLTMDQTLDVCSVFWYVCGHLFLR